MPPAQPAAATSTASYGTNRSSRTGGQQKHEEHNGEAVNWVSKKDDQPLELSDFNHHEGQPDGGEVNHQADGTRFTHFSAKYKRSYDRDDTQTAYDRQRPAQDIHSSQIELIHPLKC